MRYFPPLLGATAVDHQIKLIGQPVIKVAVDRVPASAPVPGPLLYDTTDSQLKRDTREEKLRPLFVAMRGDVSAVAAFVGSARDLAQESVLSRVHQTLSVAQVQLPCFRSDRLAMSIWSDVSDGQQARDQHHRPAFHATSQAEHSLSVQHSRSVGGLHSAFQRVFL